MPEIVDPSLSLTSDHPRALSGADAIGPTGGGRPRVLSGMRPTGKLHLGNYMGALANWVRLQDAYESYFFIADWHALTTDYADPSRVKLNTLDVALDFLAAGLDPERSTIFIQSHVPQHAELHLLFSMITPLGWLERVPTYKEQQENIRGKDLSTYGFLGYPLLQSADILMYQPQFVPVGQDQVAHVELTREVARRFNSMYKVEVFPEPDALLTPSPKVPGLDGRKMSKSYGNTIGLTEDPAAVAAKIQGMSTGGQRIRQSDAGDPELCPVGDLHKVFSAADVLAETQKGCRQASIRCEVCKREAAKSVCAVIAPIHNKRRELESRIDETWAMLRAQSAKASARAEQTMLAVREVFDLSRDLGSARRYFVTSSDDVLKAHDLSAQAEWWELPQGECAKLLREYWRENLLPREVQLGQESNRVFTSLERELEEPFISAKKKRVLVTAAREADGGGKWEFEIPAKSYEVWTLLCWNEKYWLDDFVIPQKFYAQPFAQAKKLAKDKPIRLAVRKDGEGWKMEFVDLAARQVGDEKASGPIGITELRGNFAPLN
ncbi:MAG: tryptophan--tRNA ligase [Terracidiphilus sp.]|jgi:tryptophanyl-tRNA synthetase